MDAGTIMEATPENSTIDRNSGLGIQSANAQYPGAAAPEDGRGKASLEWDISPALARQGQLAWVVKACEPAEIPPARAAPRKTSNKRYFLPGDSVFFSSSTTTLLVAISFSRFRCASVRTFCSSVRSLRCNS